MHERVVQVFGEDIHVGQVQQLQDFAFGFLHPNLASTELCVLWVSTDLCEYAIRDRYDGAQCSIFVTNNGEYAEWADSLSADAC